MTALSSGRRWSGLVSAVAMGGLLWSSAALPGHAAECATGRQSNLDDPIYAEQDGSGGAYAGLQGTTGPDGFAEAGVGPSSGLSVRGRSNDGSANGYVVLSPSEQDVCVQGVRP